MPVVIRRGEAAEAVVDDSRHLRQILRRLRGLIRETVLRIPDLLFRPEVQPERHDGVDQNLIFGFVCAAEQSAQREIKVVPDGDRDVFAEFERAALRRRVGLTSMRFSGISQK